MADAKQNSALHDLVLHRQALWRGAASGVIPYSPLQQAISELCVDPKPVLTPFDLIESADDWCIAMDPIGIADALASEPNAACYVIAGPEEALLSVGEKRFQLAPLPDEVLASPTRLSPGAKVLVAEVWPNGEHKAVEFVVSAPSAPAPTP